MGLVQTEKLAARSFHRVNKPLRRIYKDSREYSKVKYNWRNYTW